MIPIIVTSFLIAMGLIVVLMERRKPANPLTKGDLNHLRMANWIERQLTDDMVRPMIDPISITEGRSLLKVYYGEVPQQLKEKNEA